MEKIDKKMVDVSVIVPIYGVEEYVEELVRQLFTQTKTDGVEFILVNDCTKDSSMSIVRKVIEEYPLLDIKIIEHEKNKGLAGARKTGTDIAQGEYILHIDSDDLCDVGMVEGLYKAAKENDADIVACDFQRSEDGKLRAVKEPISDDGFKCVSDMLSNKMHGMVWNKLMRRSLYVDNSIESVQGINLGEDLVLCSKLFCYAKKIVYLPEIYYTYRYREQSITAQYAKERLGDIEAYLKEIERFFVERGLYDKLERPLMYKKVIEKLSLMKNTRGKTRRHYAKAYPEATKYIMQCDTLPYYLRVAVLQATKGNIIPFNAIMMYRKLRGAKKA